MGTVNEPSAAMYNLNLLYTICDEPCHTDARAIRLLGTGVDFLDHNQNVSVVGGYQDFVIVSSNAQKGELVERVEVADARSGRGHQRRHQLTVTKRLVLVAGGNPNEVTVEIGHDYAGITWRVCHPSLNTRQRALNVRH